jgi:hypothetical protein
MTEKRTIVKGFYNREEETPVYEEEHFIPVDEQNEEEQDSINLTWIIWAFAIAIAITLGISIASLTLNAIMNKKINKIEYEQRRNSRNISECPQSLHISRTSNGIWQIQDCSR